MSSRACSNRKRNPEQKVAAPCDANSSPPFFYQAAYFDWLRSITLSLSVLAALLACGTAKAQVEPQAAPARGAEAPASTAQAPAQKTQNETQKIRILLARELRDRLPPVSLLNLRPDDEGVPGALLAIDDNNTTGKFMNQEFTLDVVEKKEPDALVAAVVDKVNSSTPFIVADLAPDTLLKLSDALAGKDAIIFNASAPDQRLREADCRTNVKHTAPSRAMLADALGQYMAVKRWTNWLMVVGTEPGDVLYAEALKKSAKKFRMNVVGEMQFKYEVGSRRADGGYEQIQQQIPSFLQNAPAHDVVVVVDEGRLFGDYFPYRTWQPRPVIGTVGLYATSWHPAIELWGGTQFQNRFKRLAKRDMRALDYNVWMAVRSIGEAATRKRSADPHVLIAYMRTPEFEIAAFKGRKLTYREWNGQLRQPIILATDNLHVTVSPQKEFLHQFSELDTLGIDRGESACKAYQK